MQLETPAGQSPLPDSTLPAFIATGRLIGEPVCIVPGHPVSGIILIKFDRYRRNNVEAAFRRVARHIGYFADDTR